MREEEAVEGYILVMECNLSEAFNLLSKFV
jgi:hypothetical protein